MVYNEKNKNICEKLGALQFQKVVFKVEKLKYRIIKKLFPNIYDWYTKRCDVIMNRKLKRASDENQRKYIIDFYRKEKMLFKKELETEKNRNYHIDYNNIYDIIDWLEKNKKIHVKDLEKNLIIILILLMLSSIFPIFSISFIIYELICVFVNIECINLQNYNLCRLNDDKVKKYFNRVEQKKEEYFEKNMSNGINPISRAFIRGIDIPSIDDIIDEVTNKEEAVELLKYVKKRIKEDTKRKELKR